MTSGVGDLNGSGPQQVYIDCYLENQDVATNRSQFRLIVSYLAKGYGSWSGATQSWSAAAGGHTFSGSFVIGSPGTADIVLLNTTFLVYHDSAGYLNNFTATGCIDTSHGSIGDGCVAVWVGAPRIPKPPPAPIPAFIDQVGTTSFRYGYNSGGDGGSVVTSRGVQYATQADFSDAVLVDGGGGLIVISGLAPGTNYHVRAREQNAVGVGPWSSVLSQTTLPATAPGLTIAPDVSGTAATLTMSPPGGVSGVTKYLVERRIGTGTATTFETTTTTLLQSGLTPGTTYQWRAAAVIGGYTSPYTAWTPMMMPSPNTNPGDFYDGSTAAKPDLTYAWVSTAENSASTATGKHPTGRRTFADGSAAGASGAVYRITGGIHGQFASRTVFFSDATAAGYRGGQVLGNPGLTAVQALQAYWGSVFVRPNRSQRMAAEITYLNAAFAVVGSVAVGAAEVVAAGVTKRLTVQATAPATAVWASVGWRDVSGTGWSTWKGGDSIVDDAMMISLELFNYFDGDTIDGIYKYEWTGSANASTSIRTGGSESGDGGVDMLFDPDCLVIPSPPRPPIVLDDCIEEVGVWRRYWIQVPPGEVSAWAKEIPTLEMSTGATAERQVRVRYYANPEGLTIEQAASALRSWEAEQVISYIPPGTKITLDGVSERAWANVGTAEAQPADHLLYGTGGEPATWAALTCGVGYLIALDTPLDSPVGNLSSNLFLTQRV